MSAPEAARPVQLQVNTNGAWKTVARFDACDQPKVDAATQAATALHEVDKHVGWRIATVDRHPVVLMAMSLSTYGLWMKAEVPT